MSDMFIKELFFSFVDDLITFTRSKRGGFEFTTNWSYTGLDAFEHEPPVIPVVHHLLGSDFPFSEISNTVLPIFVSYITY